MNKEQQEKHLEHIFSKMREIMLKKGNDYATQDRLSNFKLAGNICGISPEIQCLSLIATKVARLSVLLHNQNKPNYESISDSIIDLINYAALLDMLLFDKEEDKTKQSLKKFIQDKTKGYWNNQTSTEDNQPTGRKLETIFERWKDDICDKCFGLGMIKIQNQYLSEKMEECPKCKGIGVI